MSNLRNLIAEQTIVHLDSFELESGITLRNVPVAYKTWGKLNAEGTNGMVICHALSGSADVEDWWGPLLGPGRAFDTDVFFIFCGNVLGSPYGTASPVTTNPETNQPYGPNFPIATIRDDVRLLKQILDNLGVKQIQFAIGGSMGGMQVLEWACLGVEYVRNIVPIATSGRHSAWCISWGEAQRQAIYSDPNYANGHYTAENPPNTGLAAARMQALLTYRSRNSFESRFGRKVMPPKPLDEPTRNLYESAAIHHNEGHKIRLHQSKEAAAEAASAIVGENAPRVYSAQSYLRYQGDKFVKRFDANCYISITRKMDTHDISRGRGEFYEVLTRISQPTLVIGIESDGLFTIGEQRELAEHIPNAELIVIISPEGHDGFLLEFEQMNKYISDFIRRHGQTLFKGKPIAEVTSEQFTVTKNSVFGEAEDAMMW
ncbi:homoserine O-acetyltransferase [Spizellomyces sp. 'palustris']|nr:homoserine O-acetyltransferase [Spizellomyces sp. 'palustris']